jgi:hypothetical protein
MTLDEAIKHCKEKTEHLRDGVRTCQSMTVAEQADCLECANEHEQLGKWLEDYKRLLEERPQGEYVDISKLRLMTVEECAGHTIDYAMGWKACIEWIKKGGAE